MRFSVLDAFFLVALVKNFNLYYEVTATNQLFNASLPPCSASTGRAHVH